MKVVILAGGRPSTISDENEGIPKPMVEVGGKPLIWHIMKSFSKYGFDEFIVCGGYKVHKIKKYFMNYRYYESDITIDFETDELILHNSPTEKWKVTVADTGIDALTGERVAAIAKYITDDDFIVTYGDCLSDVNIQELVRYHVENGKKSTLVVAGTTGRNEALRIGDDGKLLGKAADVDGAWTNACLYVLKKEVCNLLGKSSQLETALMQNLVSEGEMVTFKHHGFWMPVETYRDRTVVEEMLRKGYAPWMGRKE